MKNTFRQKTKDKINGDIALEDVRMLLWAANAQTVQKEELCVYYKKLRVVTG